MFMDKSKGDAELVRAYLSGKEAAFVKLYNKYERPLFSFILRFFKNIQIAEDVFQQTWIKVINGLPDYEERGSFSSWLFGIANNCSIDYIRKRKRSKIDESRDAEDLSMYADPDGDSEREFIEDEERDFLMRAVDRLPEDQKRVVLMRIIGDLPFKEIARALDCPLNTVLGRMHYAVRNLKKIVNQNMGRI